MSDADWIEVLVVVMSLVILGGVGWTFAREMFIWKSTNDQHDLLQQFNDTIKEQTKCMKEQFDDAERRIDRFEGLSAGQKQELVNLIVATEQRIIGSLRDMLMRSQGMNVNFNHDANGTQIGNHNKQQS